MPKILIADDEPETLELLSHALRLGGYEVDGARNGEELLEKIESSSPDLIILDVMMPGMDGYSTLVRIRENEKNRNIPVIISTGKGGLEDFFRTSEKSKIDDFIEKPYSIRILIEKIKGLLGKK